MPPLKHGPGARFGRLVIQTREGTRITCLCDCGNITVVSLANLCTGHTQSCGCLRAEVTADRSYKHGASRRGKKTPTYNIWCGMVKHSCTDQNDKNWPNYGGRGIAVCERWQSFENFLADMGERPEGGTIERIDHNGPYSPGNCTWATRKEQNRNTRRNKILTYGDKTQTLAQWAEDLGINHASLLGRLNRGWSLERALTEVPRGRL
jgi:hypothetical protein